MSGRRLPLGVRPPEAATSARQQDARPKIRLPRPVGRHDPGWPPTIGGRAVAQPNELQLKLDAREVSLAQLVSASSIFAALLREVSREYTGSERAVKWTVEVHGGSVTLPIKGRSTSD